MFENIPNKIMICYSGSKLYGTDTPSSDTDYCGLFMKSKNELFGLTRGDEYQASTGDNYSANSKEDIDSTMYSIHRFFELAMKANPNILELFFVPESKRLFTSDLYFEIQSMKDMFITKNLFKSYFGYSNEQRKLLKTKTERFNALKNSYDYVTSISNDTLTEYDVQVLSGLHYGAFKNKVGENRAYMVKQPMQQVRDHLKKEIDAYGSRADNIRKYGFECKFAGHLLRLLYQGLELAETKTIQLPMIEEHRKVILNTKTGIYTFEEVMEICDVLFKKFQEVEQNSTLPERSDFDKINKYLIDLTEKYIKEG